VCETFSAEVCGTWTLGEDGYAGAWADGATATIGVARFTRNAAEFHRVDHGKNVDFTAVYTGAVRGRTAAGAVTWTSRGVPRTGTWTAEW
jgi:hypothetical protein